MGISYCRAAIFKEYVAQEIEYLFREESEIESVSGAYPA